MTRVRSRKQLK